MSLGASHKSKTIVALLFEQALDFKLSFGSSTECDPQMEHLLPFGRSALESGLDEHKARASQNSVDQKEILEPIRVNRRNPPLFHSHALPAVKCAKGKTSTKLTWVTSELSPHPTSYGDMCAQVDSNVPGSYEGTQ